MVRWLGLWDCLLMAVLEGEIIGKSRRVGWISA